MTSKPHKWLISTRSNPPLKSAGDFPQMVSNRITLVKPINVGFLSRFFCFFNRRLLVKIIKTFRLTISRGEILISLLLAIIQDEKNTEYFNL